MSNNFPKPPVIEMRRVACGSLHDPSLRMVEEVDWTVAAGDFWAVGGLQGSGKSDFLFMTGGLAAPVAGTYRFFGEPMPIFEEHRVKERLRLGFVFDGGQLFNHLSIRDNVSLAVRYHGNLSRAEADPEVERMLALCELERWADLGPGGVSRNWHKRVALARALMLKPEVLLLDNPLAGLDLRHRRWWLRFLEALSAGHEWMNGHPATLVVTTDDLRPWENRARRFAVLKNRRFVNLGTWAEVQAAGDELVSELLAVAPPGG